MSEQDIAARLRAFAYSYDANGTAEELAITAADELDARQAEIERLTAERDAMRARIAEADGQVPIAWRVYVSETQTGYYVEELDDPQFVDDATNHGATAEALFTRPIPAPAAGVPDVGLIAEAVRQKFIRLPRYSFLSPAGGGVVRFADKSGNWVEWVLVHALFDAEVFASAAPQPGEQRDGV